MIRGQLDAPIEIELELTAIANGSLLPLSYR
jgi:hypothetical protein